MTVGEIKSLVMFQTNNDADDLGDFMPYLLGYINEGYDRLIHAYAGQHVGDDGVDPLKADSDIPQLPAWSHKGIADWATWLIYCNGNAQKQNRGFAFRSSAEETVVRITSENGKNGKVRNFKNIPW
jgi:hypothetical protein